jgi:hypothetical protein
VEDWREVPLLRQRQDKQACREKPSLSSAMQHLPKIIFAYGQHYFARLASSFVQVVSCNIIARRGKKVNIKQATRPPFGFTSQDRLLFGTANKEGITRLEVAFAERHN